MSPFGVNVDPADIAVKWVVPTDPAFRVEGGKQLADLARRLKAEAPAIRRKLPGRLRKAVEPIAAEAKTAAAAHSRSIPRSIRVRSSLTGQTASVRLVADRNAMPTQHKSLPALMELGSRGSGGRFIRHPVFNTGTWTQQPTHPYFYPTVQRNAGRVEKAVLALVDEVTKEAGFDGR